MKITANPCRIYPPKPCRFRRSGPSILPMSPGSSPSIVGGDTLTCRSWRRYIHTILIYRRPGMSYLVFNHQMCFFFLSGVAAPLAGTDATFAPPKPQTPPGFRHRNEKSVSDSTNTNARISNIPYKGQVIRALSLFSLAQYPDS